MSFSRLAAGIVGVLLFAAGLTSWYLRRSETSASADRPQRIAVLPFENQTGAGSLNWAEQAASVAALRQLQTLPKVSVFLARTANEGVGLGATYLVYGYVAGFPAKPVLRHFIEDAAKRQVVAQGASDGSPWFRNLSNIASGVQSVARPSGKLAPFEFHSEQSARLFAEGWKAPNPEAVSRFEAAAMADPACGWCWTAWVERAAAINASDALHVLARSRDQGNDISPISRARLDLQEAVLRRDQAARRAALQRLVREAPSDVSALADLSNLNTAAGDFNQASGLLRRALETEPNRADLWNILAYSLANAGRFDEANNAAAQYAKLDQSANPPDSQGEIALLAGRFPEAAQFFTTSYEKDRNFNQGAALEKAALAQWLNGKAPESGQLLEKYLTDRRRANDPLADLTSARWQYLFGQTVQARRQMQVIISDPRNPAASIAASLLAFHAAAGGQWDEARQAALAARTLARNPVQQLFASMAHSAARAPGAPAAEISDPNLKAESRALSLTVAAQWQPAADAWREVLKQPRGGSDAAYRELLALCLVNSGKPAEAAPLVSRVWPLLTREQSLLYDFLIFPNLFFVRAEIAAAQKKPADAMRFYDLFLRYAGDRPDPAGNLAKARNAARL